MQAGVVYLRIRARRPTQRAADLVSATAGTSRINRLSERRNSLWAALNSAAPGMCTGWVLHEIVPSPIYWCAHYGRRSRAQINPRTREPKRSRHPLTTEVQSQCQLSASMCRRASCPTALRRRPVLAFACRSGTHFLALFLWIFVWAERCRSHFRRMRFFCPLVNR